MTKNRTPLPHRIRPQDWSGFIGKEKLFERYPLLNSQEHASLIVFGPPGSGKTTLALILAEHFKLELHHFNAVLGGVNDLKKIIQKIIVLKEQDSIVSLLFIDEIHRFNKAQQDALLPYVEKGEFYFVGATTENPRSCINKALLSRIQLIELPGFDQQRAEELLEQTLSKLDWQLTDEHKQLLIDLGGGDARKILNGLETLKTYLSQEHSKDPSLKAIKQLLLENSRAYDKTKDRHYDVISAFIKSMRGSDPDAAILWLAVMLDGGEDPVFIARRCLIFASEDIGNADHKALALAVHGLEAVSKVGMPEARIVLAQVVTYLASTVKSNRAYLAIDAALEYVKSHSTLDVPDHLKNFPPKSAEKYKYPHNYPHAIVKQDYTPNPIPHFYQPSDAGTEKSIKARLQLLAKEKQSSEL